MDIASPQSSNQHHGHETQCLDPLQDCHMFSNLFRVDHQFRQWPTTSGHASLVIILSAPVAAGGAAAVGPFPRVLPAGLHGGIPRGCPGACRAACGTNVQGVPAAATVGCTAAAAGKSSGDGPAVAPEHDQERIDGAGRREDAVGEAKAGTGRGH